MKKIYLSTLLTLFAINIFGQAPTNGLVAYYPFNGNPYDESGNGNNGTEQGGVNFLNALDRLNKAGNTASFDGVDDFIETNLQQTNLTNYSISFWIKSNDNEFTIIQNRGPINQGGKSITIRYSDGKWWFALDGDFIIIGKTFSSPIPNEWVFMSFVWSSNSSTSVAPSQFKIYQNGNIQLMNDINVGTSNIPFNSSGNLKIGRHDAWNFNFGGLLDDLRIYNRALTDAEVQAIYTEESNPNLMDITISNLTELINQTSYTVPREATIHYYFLAKKTSNLTIPVKNAVLKYTIGSDPTIRTSLPSDDDGLIDLNITVGGTNVNDPDWITTLNTFYPVQFHSLAVGTITGANAFTPFQVKVMDKAIPEPDDIENGISFGLKLDALATETPSNKIGEVPIIENKAKASVGVTFGPTVTYSKNQNIWNITAGGSVGAFAEAEFSSSNSLGKFVPSLNGSIQAGITLEPNAKFKFSVDLDKASDCFKFAKSLFSAAGRNNAVYLRASSFLDNALKLTSISPLTFNGGSVGVSISATGNFSLGLSAPFNLKNFAGSGHVQQAEAGINFEASGDFTYELENDWDKNSNTQTFSNTITSGISVNSGFSLLNTLTKKSPKNIFSISAPELTIIGISKVNSLKFYNNFLYGNSTNMTGTGFTVGTQIEKNNLIQGKTHIINYDNNFEYGFKATEKIWAGFFNDPVIKLNPLASFVTLNKPLGASLISSNPVKSLTYSGLALNEYIISQAQPDWDLNEVNLNQTRDFSLITEKTFEMEKMKIASFSFSSWQTYTHKLLDTKFSSSLKRVLPTIELPNIESNVTLPNSEFFGDLIDKIEFHVTNMVAATYESAYTFFKEQKNEFLNSIKIFTNGSTASGQTLTRKTLNGELMYDSKSSNKSLNTSPPSVFTFTVNPSPQVFNTTTSIDFSYFYPENRLDAVTVSDTFRIVSDYFDLVAKDGTQIINTAPFGNFSINTNFSTTDLELASLPTNLIPRVLFKPSNTEIWQDIGAVNQIINWNKLGSFAIGVKISNDFVSPNISVTIPPIFTAPNSLLVNVSDTQSGIDWAKIKIWANGQIINFTRVGLTNQFSLPISTFPTIPENVFNIQMAVYDLAGNVKFWENILPCAYSKTINILKNENPNIETAKAYIDIDAKVPIYQTLILRAGQNIILKPGFEVTGNVFTAEIGGCNN